jgi:iron-sulfur cluster repair protein YtfE (RIC family)
MSTTQSGRSSGARQDSDSQNLSGSRSLSVNAAFLKDIKDDNRELKHLLDQLTPMTSHPEIASNHWSEIAQVLADLRDQLAFHFSLEEAYGYFDEAVETEPQLSMTAGMLKNEHTELFEHARSLADQVVDVPSSEREKIAKFLTKLQKFRFQFERHEEAELKLILDALSDDIGVGD